MTFIIRGDSINKKLTGLIFILFLVACSSDKESLTLKGQDSINLLVVQKIENATLEDSFQSFITDKSTISGYLALIEENTLQFNEFTGNLFSKLQSESYYSFAFFEGEETETPQKGTYAVYLFEDDTIIFTDVTGNQSYINQDPEDNLLNSFKQNLPISE